MVSVRKMWIHGELRTPRRLGDVAGLAYFFVAEDSDDAVFADFGLAGSGWGVVVLDGEFHALGGEQAPGFLAFATPIDVHAGDAALLRHDLVMSAKAGDAGDGGLVGEGIERRGVREDFEHVADAEVVAVAGLDIGKVLPDGREMGVFGPFEVAQFFLHHRQRIHDGF